MLDFFQIAHPFFLFVLVLVILAILWILSRIERRLRVAEDHQQLLRREQEQLDEALAVLSNRKAAQSDQD